MKKTTKDDYIQSVYKVIFYIEQNYNYAMFLHKGAYENLKSTYDMIGDWIVESGVEMRDLPMFEKYLNKDPRRTKPQNLKTEIYVPLK
jgi:AraC family transcriptional regulator